MLQQDAAGGIAHKVVVFAVFLVRIHHLGVVQIQHTLAVGREGLEGGDVVGGGRLKHAHRARGRQSGHIRGRDDSAAGRDAGHTPFLIDRGHSGIAGGPSQLIGRIGGNGLQRHGEGEALRHGKGLCHIEGGEHIHVHHIEGHHAALLLDVGESVVAGGSGPGEQVAGLGSIVERGHMVAPGIGVGASILAVGASGPHQLVVVVRGIGIHGVSPPSILVALIHPEHQHAVAGQIGIPPGALPVLQHEKLVLPGRVDAVAGVRGGHILQAEAAHSVYELHLVVADKAHGPFLIE